MLSVFICEDDEAQRSRIETIVNNKIMIDELDMELVLSTSNPYEIVDYLNAHQETRGVYFLDVDLKQDMNGIQLGSFIRERDIEGKIIFITTHNELLVLTFEYKVEALDFIIKDDIDIIKDRIQESLNQAQKHYHVNTSPIKNRIKITVGNQLRVFQMDDVMFIETSQIPHKLILHLKNSTVEFYGKINEMINLDPSMFRTHKSYVVNIDNIESIDKKQRLITMKNEETCLLSIPQIRKLESTIMMK